MKRIFILVIVLALGATIGGLIVVLNKPSGAAAQSIPAGSTFSDARMLSNGTKLACLSNNQAAEDKVDAIESPNMGQSFGLVLGSQIIDVPAGEIDSTVHSFDGSKATGSITYSAPSQAKLVGDLKTFNYAASVNDKNSWKIDSFVACK